MQSVTCDLSDQCYGPQNSDHCRVYIWVFRGGSLPRQRFPTKHCSVFTSFRFWFSFWWTQVSSHRSGSVQGMNHWDLQSHCLCQLVPWLALGELAPGNAIPTVERLKFVKLSNLDDMESLLSRWPVTDCASSDDVTFLKGSQVHDGGRREEASRAGTGGISVSCPRLSCLFLSLLPGVKCLGRNGTLKTLFNPTVWEPLLSDRGQVTGSGPSKGPAGECVPEKSTAPS